VVLMCSFITVRHLMVIEHFMFVMVFMLHNATPLCSCTTVYYATIITILQSNEFLNQRQTAL
ncbi:MAG: hypothetical protein MUO76_04450, partial [Anaerolineaceae bacterium]|nr:hypothetical protein [Anaerolineaceae bacterium]